VNSVGRLVTENKCAVSTPGVTRGSVFPPRKLESGPCPCELLVMRGEGETLSLNHEGHLASGRCGEVTLTGGFPPAARPGQGLCTGATHVR